MTTPANQQSAWGVTDQPPYEYPIQDKSQMSYGPPILPTPLPGPNEPPPPYPGPPPPGLQTYPPIGQAFPPPDPNLPNVPQTQLVGAPQMTNVIVVQGGDCPRCQRGMVQEKTTTAGILICIFCFPCGIPALCLMKQRQCSACGTTF